MKMAGPRPAIFVVGGSIFVGGSMTPGPRPSFARPGSSASGSASRIRKGSTRPQAEMFVYALQRSGMDGRVKPGHDERER